jgi:hypothetical protein
MWGRVGRAMAGAVRYHDGEQLRRPRPVRFDISTVIGGTGVRRDAHRSPDSTN